MYTFAAPDGTRLAYHVNGAGDPLICLPGGPMRASAYLDDLGGLSTHRRLIMLDLRGTGRSAVPDDASSYRCDRLVDDVEALRGHLGLSRMDLLAHSAGANLAVLYAARYPGNVGTLCLVGPSTRAVGVTVTGQTRRDLARLRGNEPWFPAAYAALERVTAGTASDADWDAVAPFFHGRWDDAARDLDAAQERQSNAEAADIFGSDGAFEPDTTRKALAVHQEPVLVLAGEFDMNTPPVAATEVAGLFPHATLAVQPGAGHYPWLDDRDQFVATIVPFLG